MCRLAAYSGPAVSLASLLYEAPHSLERQAYLPERMVSGHVNVDGTGAAWWNADNDAPLRYVSERPPWSDPNLPALAARLSGAPQLVVVRSRTAGMPSGVEAAHPFVYKRWAGTHNGFLEPFEEVRWRLVEALSPSTRPHLTTFSDSLLLFLGVVSAVERDGMPLVDALIATAAGAARLCRDAGGRASLNLVVAEPERIVGLRSANGMAANSLYWIENGERWPHARLLASEPLDDDDGWHEVAPDHAVTISADGVECVPTA